MQQQQQILHYPRLDTVLMVEELLKERGEFKSRRSLWMALPKKMMYQTFMVILRYLEDSGKIVTKKGEIIWIWNPELVKRYKGTKLAVE